MRPDAAVYVEGVSKKFCRDLRRSMWYGAADVLRRMGGLAEERDTLRKDEFWALDDVNFEARRGEAFGIVGANGSGKSTLLRLVTGIFPPDKGRISVRGRVGALISVGAGFHPHMTGAENIHLNGTILGMGRREIAAKYDEIVEFAELGEFLGAPVATYSSGMKVRLGFSIAIHAPINLLVADEILAVGDARFRRKCFEKVRRLKRAGVSVLFVSHSNQTLESVCERGVVLHEGRQAFLGGIRDCIRSYMGILERDNQAKALARNSRQANAGAGNVEFSDVRVYQEGGDPDSSEIEFGKNIVIEFGYRFLERETDDYQLRVGLKTAEGMNIQKLHVEEGRFTDGRVYANEMRARLGRQGRARVRLLAPRLFPQTFLLDIGVKSQRMGVLEGGVFNAAAFRIVELRDGTRYFEHGHGSVAEFDYEIEIECADDAEARSRAGTL